MKTSNEPLTYSRFIDGYIFYHPRFPNNRYFLNEARNKIYKDSDKSTVAHVNHINSSSFEASYLLLFQIAKCLFSYSDFIAIVPEDETCSLSQ